MDQRATANDVKQIRDFMKGLEQALQSTTEYKGKPFGAGHYQLPAFLQRDYQDAQEAMKRLERALL